MPSSSNQIDVFDVEAEKSLLGSLLLNRDGIDLIEGMVEPSHFHHPNNAVVYAAMLALYEKGAKLDLSLVMNELGTKLEGIGGIPYLTSLTMLIPDGTNVTHYAEIVGNNARRTQFLRSLQFGLEGFGDLDTELTTAKEQFEEMYYQQELFESHAAGLVHISEAVELVRQRQKMLRENKGALTGVPYGFIDLDAWTSGLQCKELVTLCGRTGMGKSAFLTNIMYHVSVKMGLSTLLWSVEMSKESVTQRMIPLESGVNAEKIRDGKLDDFESDQVDCALNRLAEAPIYVDDQGGLRFQDFRTRLRRQAAREQPALVCVDYLQLMRFPGARGEYENVTAITKALRDAAKEFDVPILALAQLSRKTEERGSKEPTLADLKGSGEIEQTSDLVLGLHRPGYYDPNCDERDVTKLFVMKHRNGRSGEIGLIFDADHLRFHDAAPAYTW